MKGKILVSLFALPFFAVGVWMLYSISTAAYDIHRMQDWVAVEAQLTAAGYATNPGDDSDTYRAFAEYTYSYQGVLFSGDRVSISSGGDNIGNFQRRLGNKLSSALARGVPITVYIDREEPADSIVDKTFRWGLMGFKLIFVIVFGGFGLGLLIFTWRASKLKDKTSALYRDAPWLLNDQWQTATIRSNSKSSMYAAWFTAAVWNLISAALPFLIYREVVSNQNYIALIGLLFPVVGLGLLIWAIQRTREWLRFGPAPVTLDPFPGSIGGHVGGTIKLNVPFDASFRYAVTLTNIHSYMSGSGDSRSRKEKAMWQDALVAHSASVPGGTRLTFRFEIPEDLDEADAQRDDSYYLWRLNLHANLPGADISRDYELPVYATATQSRLLSDRASEQSRTAQKAIDEQAIRGLVDLSYGANGKQMFYRAGRHFLSSIGGFVVGSVFAAAGWWLIAEEGMTIFGSIFAGTGGLIAIATLYMMLNSLEVYQDGNRIVSVRRVLGIPVRIQQIARHEFLRLDTESSMQTQSGGKHTMYYKVMAVDKNGYSIVVGDGFKGVNQARAAVRLIAQEFGLQQPLDSAPSGYADELLGPEVLT